MRVAFLLFTYLLCFVQLSGKQASNHSIKQYYNLTDRAEMAIIDSNYVAALDLYKQAFVLKEPNELDIVNAFIVAYIERDSLTAKACFDRLAIHGATKVYFDQTMFAGQVKGEDMYKWITSSYDSLHAISLSNGMSSFAKAVDSIVLLDQSVRQAKGTPSQDELKAMLHQDSINIKLMKELVVKKGFPGYDKVGHYQSWMGSPGWINTSSSFWLLPWHTRNFNKELGEIALDAVHKGEHPPDELAAIIDMQQSQSIFYELLPRDAKNNFAFLPVPDSAKVNQKRAEIYLESLENLRRKIAYNHIDKRFYLVPDWIRFINEARMDFKEWNQGN